MMLGRDAAATDRWPLARAQYEEAARTALETTQFTWLAAATAGLSWLDALEGREDECRRHADEGRRLSEQYGMGLYKSWSMIALGQLELGLGKPDRALPHFLECAAFLNTISIEDPDVSPVPDIVDALVRLGRFADARRASERFLQDAEAKGQPFALARAAWRRGASVTLIAGHVDIPLPVEIPTVKAGTVQEMSASVAKTLPTADVLIMAAAPADFRPVSEVPQKIKKLRGGGVRVERLHDLRTIRLELEAFERQLRQPKLQPPVDRIGRRLGEEIGEQFPKLIEQLVISIALTANCLDYCGFTRLSNVVRSFIKGRVEPFAMFLQLSKGFLTLAQQCEESRGILLLKTLLHFLRRYYGVVVIGDDAARDTSHFPQPPGAPPSEHHEGSHEHEIAK